MLRYYCAIRTRLHALAALYTFALVYNSVLVNNRYSVLRTVLLALVCQTTPASRRNHNSVNGTFVTSYIYNFNDIRIVFVAAERKFNSFADYRPFLIDTTTHSRIRSRDNLFRNVKINAFQISVVYMFDDGFQRFIFK